FRSLSLHMVTRKVGRRVDGDDSNFMQLLAFGTALVLASSLAWLLAWVTEVVDGRVWFWHAFGDGVVLHNLVRRPSSGTPRRYPKQPDLDPGPGLVTPQNAITTDQT